MYLFIHLFCLKFLFIAAESLAKEGCETARGDGQIKKANFVYKRLVKGNFEI